MRERQEEEERGSCWALEEGIGWMLGAYRENGGGTLLMLIEGRYSWCWGCGCVRFATILSTREEAESSSSRQVKMFRKD